MAVPTSINDLSVTVASNSPSGSDAIGTSLDDYLRAIQAIVKESGAILYNATGTNTITFSTTPTFASYSTGQRFFVKAAAANTGAVTININGIGAKNVYKGGATPIVSGDIPVANCIFLIEYDGTQFQLLNAAIPVTKVFNWLSITNNSTTTGASTIDWTAGNMQSQTEPTGAITYTFTAPNGPCHLQLQIASDGTSAAYTHVWPGTVIWLGSTWAAAANKKAVINFWYDGTNYYAQGANQV
jgi:hypothetical protein